MTPCGCRVLFRTQPIPRVRVPPRSQPVRVLSPKTRLFVVPVSFEESFTFEDAYRVTRKFITTAWNPRRSLLKFSNRRSAVILNALNIEITLHRGANHFFTPS